ncbi:MAG: 3'-5' exonuclease domain-containing protein 2 [Bdellovibrio sp.]|nr:3'-5' exonuclease domain-containing protein 2 [Bdellovibrio sp.]
MRWGLRKVSSQNPTTPFAKPVQLPRISFPGKIHLINSDQELQAIAAELSSAKELGFDTETRPSFKKGEVHKVALLQLSTDADAYIIRLHYVTQFQFIKSIFENEAIAKVGVAIRDDLKTLQKTFSFVPKNFTELQTLAKTKGMQNFGLKGMTEEVMQMALSKGPKLTNWEARELSSQQVMYAATDAWIGLTLYRKLILMPDKAKT